MDGGRYIGSGTYGCVFTPPLLCKTGKQPSEKLVGKITTHKLAQQEIQVANKLRKFPLVRNYFLLPEPESCELAPEGEQVDPGIQECRDDFKTHGDDLDLDKMAQITIPFGGTKAYYELFLDQSLHPKRFDFFGFMKHILEAGSTMLLVGVCHFDLHAGNLLMDNKKVVRILDFGMSFPKNLINDVTLSGRWKRLRFGFEYDAAHPSIHNSEAPEITIMNAIRKGDYTVPNAVKLTVLGKDVFNDMEKYLGISRAKSRDELLEFFTKSDYARKRNFIMLWRTYWPGFDSWSLGCILLETLKMLLLLPEFTEGEYKTKKPAVLATLRGMLAPNPKERLDCLEALALFDPGNAWVARFGKKWLHVRKQQRRLKIEGGGDELDATPLE
jgi:serine/threonine protein kinase